MSHLKERTEKICLNCKTELVGRYCHICGQENLEPKETVWHLVQHFFNDITHFDGKFFSTVKLLLRRPGFLSREYMEGRRASYLNPIRMYVFTSAIFFLILFSLKRPEKYFHPATMKNGVHVENKEGEPDWVFSVTDNGETLDSLEKRKVRKEDKLKKAEDEDDRDELTASIRTLGFQTSLIRKTYGDTTTHAFTDDELTALVLKAYVDSLKQAGLPVAIRTSLNKKVDNIRKTGSEDDDSPSFFGIDAKRYKTIADYDSVERALPDSLRDGWVLRNVTKKIILANAEYHADKRRYREHFAENFLHSFPKILFFSLPIFALILNILYTREKKEFFYVSHGIFAIHVYCATFILILLALLLNKLGNMVDMGWFYILESVFQLGIWFYCLIYLYKAMRGFYRQRRAKTFIKYSIVCFLSLIVNLIILVGFVIFSAVSV